MIPTPLPAIPFGGSDLAISWGGKRRQYEPKSLLSGPFDSGERAAAIE